MQTEIETEQAYVSALYAHLDTLRARAAQALDQARRAPVVPTPSGRGERDAFDAWHSERIARLASVEDRLAFGRLDLRDGERRYVGRIGLSDDAQHQLLIDWRAPAASAFYQATAAAPAGVGRRRHLSTRARQVIGIDDEVLDGDALAEAGLKTVVGQGALMSALTAHRTGRMRDIVATLQSEQDRIVRAPLPGVLVVQGGPGTGKTAVALHRAAYLLYTHRDRIARSGVLVVGPTPVFLQYIEQVLPSLGETGVVLLTPGQLFPGVDATRREPAELAVLKGDLRMAEVIRQAVRARQRSLERPLTFSLDGDRITLRPRVVADARGRARQSGRPHNDARVIFVRHLLDDLAAQLAAARSVPLDEDRADLLDDLRSHRDVRRELNLLWMPLTAEGLLTSLLTRADRLAEAAQGLLSRAEQQMLLNPVEQQVLPKPEPELEWSISDVPLLDEAAELIGADVAIGAAQRAAQAGAAAERSEALAFARTVLDSAGEAASMMTAEMLADRFEGSGPPRTLSEQAGADRNWAYGHAVIDEAQELSAMQWRVLTRRVPTRSMTVVGDVAQTGSAAGTTSWAQVLDVQAADRWRLEELTVNYRTPAAVMELATGLLAAAGITLAPISSARDGDWPPLGVRLPGRDDAAVVAAIIAAVQADDEALGGGRFAVIVPRGFSDALTGLVSQQLAGAVRGGGRAEVLSVDDAKGLEFDSVVVVDPAAITAASARGVNDLYVALTRPTQRLTVLHHGDLPAGLESLVSRAGSPSR